jgi:hypothetical protein
MIFWFENSANNVENCSNFVYLLSSTSSRKSGLHVQSNVLSEAISLFMARTLVKQKWINDQNRFLKPNSMKKI